MLDAASIERAREHSEGSKYSERSDFVQRGTLTVEYRYGRDKYGWWVEVTPENGPKVKGYNRTCPWATLLALAGLVGQTANLREELRAEGRR